MRGNVAVISGVRPALVLFLPGSVLLAELAFEERHHFDPPHRIEPERLAVSLRHVWKRAEDRARDA